MIPNTEDDELGDEEIPEDGTEIEYHCPVCSKNFDKVKYLISSSWNFTGTDEESESNSVILLFSTMHSMAIFVLTRE